MDEPDRHIRTDPDIASYAGYLPDDWVREKIEPIAVGTVLERLLLDLAMGWRCASYTAQMPATSIRAMHAAALGRSKFVSPDSSIVAFSQQIIAKLAGRVPELFENSKLRARCVAELVTISAEFRDRAEAVKNEITIEPVWTEFMNDVAFRISLWASQRVAFLAFYNAYEAFIVDCLKIGTETSKLQSIDKAPFYAALRNGLTKDISTPCWFHSEINIARLVRHALSHNGGRETAKLKEQHHQIEVIDGELQIVPGDIHRMMRRLRMGVEEVIIVTRSDPKFMAPAATRPEPPGADE